MKSLQFEIEKEELGPATARVPLLAFFAVITLFLVVAFAPFFAPKVEAGCTWQSYDPSMGNWVEVKNCNSVDPGQTACTQLGCTDYGLPSCPGSASAGGASTYSDGYVCQMNSTRTVSPSGIPAEGGMCYARGLVSVCTNTCDSGWSEGELAFDGWKGSAGWWCQSSSYGACRPSPVGQTGGNLPSAKGNVQFCCYTDGDALGYLRSCSGSPTPTPPPPTAHLFVSVNGMANSKEVTVNVDDRLTYKWNGDDGVRDDWSSTWSSSCGGGGPWSASNDDGESRDNLVTRDQAGCTYTIIYDVRGPGGRDTDTVKVHVNAAAPSCSYTTYWANCSVSCGTGTEYEYYNVTAGSCAFSTGQATGNTRSCTRAVCPPVVNNSPYGWLDPGSNCTTLRGWTCDADNFAGAVPVDLYVNGSPLTGLSANQDSAALYGTGVADQCGGNRFHQFSMATPASLKDGTNKQISAFATNIGGTGSSAWLSGSPFGLNCPAAPVTYNLAVTKAGAGVGTVTSNPAGISCSSGTCNATYNSGTPVTLSQTADAGSVFAGWSGACSGMGACTVTMNAAQSVTATFNAAPAGAPTASLTIDGYASQEVTLPPNTANTKRWTSTNGVTFGSTYIWTGASCAINGASGPWNANTESGTSDGITNPANIGCTANITYTVTNASGVSAQSTLRLTIACPSGQYWGGSSCTSIPGPTFNLSINKSGDGNGTVSSNPAGINCGSTCSAAYASGQVVNLSPSANPGSTFVGWGGDCSAAGSVSMSSAKSCTARFDLGSGVPPGGGTTVNLRQSSPTTEPSEPFTLTWGSTGATSCSMSKTVDTGSGPGAPGPVTCYPSGSKGGSCEPTPALVGAHEFTFTCDGVSDRVTHFVLNAPSLPPGPGVPPVLEADDMVVVETVTLRWTLNDGKNCTLRGGGLNMSGINSNSSTRASVDGETKFTLTCTQPDGSASVSEVTVWEQPKGFET